MKKSSKESLFVFFHYEKRLKGPKGLLGLRVRGIEPLTFCSQNRHTTTVQHSEKKANRGEKRRKRIRIFRILSMCSDFFPFSFVFLDIWISPAFLAQLEEHQPSKLICIGSNPIECASFKKLILFSCFWFSFRRSSQGEKTQEEIKKEIKREDANTKV